MTPKQMILVRHGRSAANDNTTIYNNVPNYKIELVKQGCEQLAGKVGFGGYLNS